MKGEMRAVITVRILFLLLSCIKVGVVWQIFWDAQLNPTPGCLGARLIEKSRNKKKKRKKIVSCVLKFI